MAIRDADPENYVAPPSERSHRGDLMFLTPAIAGAAVLLMALAVLSIGWVRSWEDPTLELPEEFFLTPQEASVPTTE